MTRPDLMAINEHYFIRVILFKVEAKLGAKRKVMENVVLGKRRKY